MPEYVRLTPESKPFFDEHLGNQWQRGIYPTYQLVPDSRTLAQNDLWGVWYHEISNQWEGHTPEYVHAFCKLELGIPIIDISTHEKSRRSREDWRAMSPAIDHSHELKLRFMRSLPVTRVMTVKEGIRYTDAMIEFWAERGIQLSVKAHPSYEKHFKAAA